jgi:hypothetical protein
MGGSHIQREVRVSDGWVSHGRLSSFITMGQNDLFNVYLTDVSGSFHSSGIEECENLIHWHRRDMNFFRGKLRILITFRGMEGILSISYKAVNNKHKQKIRCDS